MLELLIYVGIMVILTRVTARILRNMIAKEERASEARIAIKVARLMGR